MHNLLITFFTILFCITSTVSWSKALLVKCFLGDKNILFKVENQLINKKVSYRENGYWKPYCENNKHYNLIFNEDSFICDIKSHKLKTLHRRDGQTFTPILADQKITVDLITYQYILSHKTYNCLDYESYNKK